MYRLYQVLLAITGALFVVLPVYAMQAEDQDTPPEMVVEGKKDKPVSIESTFGSSRLDDWRVLNGRNLIIELDNGDKYRASLMNYCHGLQFTEVIGFSTLGPYELDQWTTLHLPDGERCYIRELTPYAEEKDNDKRT